MFYDEEEGRPLLKGGQNSVNDTDIYERITYSSADSVGDLSSSSSGSSSSSERSHKKINLSSLPVTCTIAILFLMSLISVIAYYGPIPILKNLSKGESLVSSDLQASDPAKLVPIGVLPSPMLSSQPPVDVGGKAVGEALGKIGISGALNSMSNGVVAASEASFAPQFLKGKTNVTDHDEEPSSSNSTDQMDPPGMNPTPVMNNTIAEHDNNSSLPEMSDPTNSKSDDHKSNITEPDTNPTPPVPPVPGMPTEAPTYAPVNFLHFHLPDEEQTPSSPQSSSSGVVSSIIESIDDSVQKVEASASELLGHNSSAPESKNYSIPIRASPEKNEISDPVPVELADESIEPQSQAQANARNKLQSPAGASLVRFTLMFVRYCLHL